jgi:hypothetical protein
MGQMYLSEWNDSAPVPLRTCPKLWIVTTCPSWRGRSGLEDASNKSETSPDMRRKRNAVRPSAHLSMIFHNILSVILPFERMQHAVLLPQGGTSQRCGVHTCPCHQVARRAPSAPSNPSLPAFLPCACLHLHELLLLLGRPTRANHLSGLRADGVHP